MIKKLPFIVFVHIERSGGTTFNQFMINNCYECLAPKYSIKLDQKKAGEKYRIFYTADDLKQLLKIFPFVKMIGGHHTRIFEEYSKVVNKPVFYFTFLRNPVERYISHFNYQRINMNIDWSVEQFVWNDRFNNWQTNRIAGDNDLDKAKYFLSNRFDFVGLTERYNESLIILKQLLGVESFQIQYSRANTSDKNKKLKNIDLIRFNELPDEIKNRIVENNKLDLELYDFVKNVVFPTYESEYKGDLKQAVDQLLQLNETFTLNKILHLKNKILRRYLKFVLRFTSHDYIY